MNFEAYADGIRAYHEGRGRGEWPSKKLKKEWQEGWDEAHRIKVQNDEEEKNNEGWKNISCNCPWLNNESALCSATHCECSKDNCAIFYFIHNLYLLNG